MLHSRLSDFNGQRRQRDFQQPVKSVKHVRDVLGAGVARIMDLLHRIDKWLQFLFTGEHFWSRGYFVSKVALDANMVRLYIRNQEEEYDRYVQMRLAVG